MCKIHNLDCSFIDTTLCMTHIVEEQWIIIINLFICHQATTCNRQGQTLSLQCRNILACANKSPLINISNNYKVLLLLTSIEMTS